MYILAVTKKTEGQKLRLLPVGGSHIVFAMPLLKSLTDPDASKLADQRMLACQPAFIILHNDADDLSKEEEWGTMFTWLKPRQKPPSTQSFYTIFTLMTVLSQMYTLIAWNWRSRRAVLVEGDPGRTVAAVPAGTSRGTKRLAFVANTSLSGLASLCFRKLCG